MNGIGPYTIIGTLGEGGMGVVYLAEQKDPIERKVAIKVVKKDRATDRLLARFNAERRALARLNHPNVAQVYDTATAEDGQPYIVMEHVPGDPITSFCDQRNATIGERIEVFIDVCKGVQHVHQKGLIHRDLKPPNILVIDQDGTWTPKIIDFGIAKGADRALIEENLTQGNLVGTPVYIAPEALRGDDQDTRVDVYALGLVLYRLLTGVKPVPPGVDANFLDLIQALAAGEAVPTMTRRFQDLDVREQTRLGRKRQSHPQELTGMFSQDLDWIVMRAIAPDPEKRYATAQELAADLRRYLDGSPVVARPPSVTYVARKMAARHRWSIAAATALVTSLLVGLLSTSVLAYQVWRQATRAEESARIADERRIEAEQVSELMDELFSAANPMEGKGPDTTVGDLLDRATASLASRDLPPLVHAKLLDTMSKSYRGIANLEAARETSEIRVAILRAKGTDRVQLANAISMLAQDELRTNRMDQARAHVDEAIAIYDSQDTVPQHRAQALSVLAQIEADQGDMEKAIETAELALALVEGGVEVKPLNVALMSELVGALEIRRGGYQKAATHFERCLEVLERDRSSPFVAHFLIVLSQLQFAGGDEEQGLANLEDASALLVELLGPDSPRTADVALKVAVLKSHTDEADEAEAYLRGVLASGDDASPMARGTALFTLAQMETVKRRFRAAEDLLGELAEDEKGRFQAEHVTRARQSLAVNLAAQERINEAEALFQAVIRERSARLGANSNATAAVYYELAHMYQWQERFREAGNAYATTLEIREQIGEPDPSNALKARARAGRAFALARDYAAAERYLRPALEDFERIEGTLSGEIVILGMVEVLDATDRGSEARELEKRQTGMEIPTDYPQ